MREREVLVVGGGPVGLGLAIDLAQRGVDVAVLERRTVPHTVPKGQNLTQRSGEHFRAWGVSRRIRAASPIPREFGSAGLTTYGTLTSGLQYDWFRRLSVRAYYDADNERLPQYETERVLQERLAELDVPVLAGWTAISVSQAHDSVEVLARDPENDLHRLRASYAVGCDGSGSIVRESSGIQQTVDDHARRMVLLVFSSPRLNTICRRFPRKSFFHIMRPHLLGYWQFLGRVDLQGTWFYHSPVSPESTLDTFDYTSHLQDAIGSPIDVELLYLGFWDLRFAVADSYRLGCVFVAGDAAHSHPPYGGYGINLGFEDARNLSWKIQAVLEGWGGSKLLDSYTLERRGVFASTARDFILRMIRDDADFLARYDPEQDEQAFNAAWKHRAEGGDVEVTEYVPHYCGSPVVADGFNTGPGAKGKHGHEVGPGMHLSPQRLSDGASSHERLGNELTLVGIDLPEETLSAYARQARELAVPLKIVGTQMSGEVKKWKASTILVRPDRFVAYASNSAPHDLTPQLLRAVGRDQQ